MTNARTILHAETTLAHLFVRSCQRYSTATAAVGEGKRLSYAELANRVARMMTVLTNLGLQRGQGFALLSSNRLDVLTAYGACYLLGLRVTPLSPMASEADLVYMLTDADITALLVDDQFFSERGRILKGAVVCLKLLLSLGDTEGAYNLVAAMDEAEPAPLNIDSKPEDIAFVSYTGGTTGKPKGVVTTHQAIVSAVRMWCAEWEWPDPLKMVVATPISHAAGAISLPVMMLGGEFHLLPGFDSPSLLSYMDKEQISATFLVPTMIYRLLDETSGHAQDLPALKTIFYGAAPIITSRLTQAIRRFGPVFMQLYGQSEIPMGISLLSRTQHQPDGSKLATCGVPLTGVEIVLLDDDGARVDAVQVGEICVRGTHIMDRYWNRPQETEEVFAGGWLHTGDMGQFDEDGYLSIVDRKTDMIITGGFNVYPSQIEEALLEYDGVHSAAAFGLPDDKWGEIVVAAVVTSPHRQMDNEALIAYLKNRVGSIQTPKKIIQLDEIPLTALGKVDKKNLQALTLTNQQTPD